MRIFHVDAFTIEAFAGNPAAVCLLDQPRGDRWLQAVGAEMNLAETAFLEPKADGFGLRWFTPTAEVDLCGHATLASAHVLWELGETDDCLRFHTRSGLLTAQRVAGAIQLDFPSQPAEPIETPDGLAEALGLTEGARWVGRSRSDYLVEVADEATVRAVAPDFGALRALPVRGIIVTATAAPGSTTGNPPDFVSRFFAPAMGIDEDHVTGSAHCCLGPYWAAKLGRNQLIGYQASPRGGTVGVRMTGDRVILSGQAVTVLQGELLDI